MPPLGGEGIPPLVDPDACSLHAAVARTAKMTSRTGFIQL
jgi:hypothetical protein